MKKLSNLDKDKERKSESGMVKSEIWLEIKCYSVFSGVKLQMVKPPNTGSLTLYQRNISPTTCWLLALLKTKLTWISSLLSHLICFVACYFISHFCFHLKGSIGLAIGLAIGTVMSMAGEVAIGLSGCFLWNQLMSFLRCCITKAGSQVFFFSRYLFQETRY